MNRETEVKNCTIEWNMREQCYQLLLRISLEGGEMIMAIDDIRLIDDKLKVGLPQVMFLQNERIMSND